MDALVAIIVGLVVIMGLLYVGFIVWGFWSMHRSIRAQQGPAGVRGFWLRVAILIAGLIVVGACSRRLIPDQYELIRSISVFLVFAFIGHKLLDRYLTPPR